VSKHPRVAATNAGEGQLEAGADRWRDEFGWGASSFLSGTERRTIMNLANRTVLITGANRGIGRALVDEALRRGAKRVYAGTRSTLQHADKRVTPLMLDVTNDSHIERAAHEVEMLDVVINCAGVAGYDNLTDPDVIQQHLNVNFLG